MRQRPEGIAIPVVLIVPRAASRSWQLAAPVPRRTAPHATVRTKINGQPAPARVAKVSDGMTAPTIMIQCGQTNLDLRVVARGGLLVTVRAPSAGSSTRDRNRRSERDD